MAHTFTNETFWPLEAKRHFYAFATFILIMIYLDLKASPLIKGFSFLNLVYFSLQGVFVQAVT